MSSKTYVKPAGRYLDQDYAPSTQYGYSCQTWLAKIVNEVLHSGTYYCWFAKSLNAFSNGDSSNPLWIYFTVDRAVKQGDINNSKVKDIRLNLMRAARKALKNQRKTQQIASLPAVIAKAPLSWLRPEIWRLNLRVIDGRYTGGHQYSDEFNVKDLAHNEFVVIVD